MLRCRPTRQYYFGARISFTKWPQFYQKNLFLIAWSSPGLDRKNSRRLTMSSIGACFGLRRLACCADVRHSIQKVEPERRALRNGSNADYQTEKFQTPGFRC